MLYRIAFKMATGSGKTVVMAMLIAWQALNKIANSQDARFSDTLRTFSESQIRKSEGGSTLRSCLHK
ncbi:MAG: hypothetical protein ABIQ77_10290 [Anaerolineales bacterium]